MKTIHLKRGLHNCWYPDDHQFFQIMFKHFTNGMIAVSDAGVEELIVVAGEHGWSVVKIED